MTSPYWLPFRLLQCDKSNLDRRGLLFWLPLGRHACFKGNLFGEVLLNQLPFRLPQHDKSNLNRRGLLFWLPLGRHACFKGNLFGKLLAYWLPPFPKSCHTFGTIFQNALFTKKQPAGQFPLSGRLPSLFTLFHYIR